MRSAAAYVPCAGGLTRDYGLLQPESLVLGGITALRKIGVSAEVFGKRLVPHHGGDIGVAAHLHLAASRPHAPLVELLHDPPDR